jgi:hypothetical protein
MYFREQLDLPNLLADSAVIPPFNEFVALPEYVTSDSSLSPFSIGEVLWEIFHLTPDSKTLFQPRVWAPGWSDQQLASYLLSPVPPQFQQEFAFKPENLRASTFLEPAQDLPADSLKGPCYDLVHFVCSLSVPRPGQVWLDDGRKAWTAEDFAARLVDCRTRFLILQCAEPNQWPAARDYSRRLVELGVPAALAFAGNAEQTKTYNLKLYGDLAHNRTLSIAAEPQVLVDPEATFRAVLIARPSADENLLLDNWIAILSNQLEYFQEQIARDAIKLSENRVQTLQKLAPFLHATQLDKLSEFHQQESTWTERLAQGLEGQRQVLATLPPQPWHHEREGSLVVSGSTESFRDAKRDLGRLLNQSGQLVARHLERQAASLNAYGPPAAPPDRMTEALLDVLPPKTFSTEWSDAFLRELSEAPRVLNAGFRRVGQTDLISMTQTLVAGAQYELLVDVGPRWDKLQSLVTGAAEFPMHALPKTRDYAYLIDVVFLSEEFSPSLVSGRISLPIDAGRSSPFSDGGTSQPGPLLLSVRAPESSPADPGASTWIAHGRLGLYYDNNLLQSAQVTMSVNRGRMGFARQPNAIAVDYVLTGGFRDIGSRFAKRRVHFTDDDAWEDTKGWGHPLAMTITLNDDGSGSHRILVMSQKTEHLDIPEHAAWMNYDPVSASTLLDPARSDLLDCFFKKDDNGIVLQESRDGSVFSVKEEDCSQPKEQFLWDLVRLAERGDALFNAVFASLKWENGTGSGAAQTRSFQKALAHPRVIQVARTGNANYVFPWALLYDIPISLDRSQNRFCDVLLEWDKTTGLRKGPANAKPYPAECPFSNESRHSQNVYCPYGFWGLKHVVEQPLGGLVLDAQNGSGQRRWRLKDAPQTFGSPGNIPLGICTTNALRDVSDLDAHLRYVASFPIFTAHLPAAEALDAAQNELLKAGFAYVFCHGKYDDSRKEPFLGIGPDDAKAQHRIYPTTVLGWARTSSWETWDSQHPLIFINGCHTCDLTPGQVLQFVSAFGFAGASGVLGTEIPVRFFLATYAGKRLFEWLAQGMNVGEAFRRLRWDLANKGNLLGLAYVPYCLADLAPAVIAQTAVPQNVVLS